MGDDIKTAMFRKNGVVAGVSLNDHVPCEMDTLVIPQLGAVFFGVSEGSTIVTNPDDDGDPENTYTACTFERRAPTPKEIKIYHQITAVVPRALKLFENKNLRCRAGGDDLVVCKATEAPAKTTGKKSAAFSAEFRIMASQSEDGESYLPDHLEILVKDPQIGSVELLDYPFDRVSKRATELFRSNQSGKKPPLKRPVPSEIINI